jgi:hypothetical protein
VSSWEVLEARISSFVEEFSAGPKSTSKLASNAVVTWDKVEGTHSSLVVRRGDGRWHLFNTL